MKALFLSIFISAILIATPLFGATFNISAGDTPGFQTALTTAGTNNEDDIINVEAGTYNITSTLTFIGGAGEDHSLTIQGAGAGSTILDGGGTVRIMSIEGGNLCNAVSISGLTFQYGNIALANGGGAYVRCNSGPITLADNIFIDNHSTGANGGGAYVASVSASVTLTGNIFTGNGAAQYGGGLYAESLSNTVALTGNIFTDNTAGFGGGVAVYSETGSIISTNNIFDGNTSTNQGGGAYVQIYNYEPPAPGPMTFTNNTFYDNTATNYGGGAYLSLARVDESNVQANVYNNIFWSNVANAGGTDGDDLYVNSNPEGGVGSVELFYNDFSGNADFTSGNSEDLFITNTAYYTQGNNIQNDPLFVNTGAGDLHLQEGSPAIDVGLNSAPSIPALDLDGKPRIINSIVDMGAYEYGSATTVPTLTEWGMIIFMLLAGLGAVYYLRRQRSADS